MTDSMPESLKQSNSSLARVAAEDVGEGFTSADDVLQAWLNSPDDKANIESDLRFGGIGIERVGQGPNYFTLLLL